MARNNQAMEDLLRYNAAILPQKRSSFDKSHSHVTTFDSGYLVPLMWDRVLPGDEKKIRYSGLARMSTPIHPVMDNANLDVWCFFVPDRLWWEHAKEFYGENKDASFNPDGRYVMPYLSYDMYSVKANPTTGTYVLDEGIGSLNDYFGFPLRVDNEIGTTFDTVEEFRVTAGLHRCYQLIWNEYYRNSSIQPALQLNTGDTVSGSEWSVIKKLRKVCKYPDYFTSLLREPQAGDDVSLPIGDWAPVVTRATRVDPGLLPGKDPLILDYTSGSINVLNKVLNVSSSDEGSVLYTGSEADTVFNSSNGLYPNNLWADLTSATAATINNLRAAVTVQQLLEIDSLAGKRYQQILQAHFGVFTPDGTLQRPELLGCTRSMIGMRQVLQTSSTTANSPQGNTAAFSLTDINNEWICNKAFTEPGFIMVLGAVRPYHSYSQGLDPLLTKLNRYDHYWPVFDNLGNQPVPQSAIYCTARSDSGSAGLGSNIAQETFGYQEAWTEYRIKHNRVSGFMRPDAPKTLASWNYSTMFIEPPILNSSFVEEDPNLIDRTIAVPSEPQFILDSYFEYFDTKNMSVHSIPGLLRL